VADAYGPDGEQHRELLATLAGTIERFADALA